MKKAKIKIEKIFRNVVQTTNGPANKFTLMYKNYGFRGWGKGSEYKEGDVVEVEYDENSKYQTGKYTYFNLIRKQENTREVLKEILEIVKRIEEKMDNSQQMEGFAEIEQKELNEKLVQLSDVLDRLLSSEMELRDKLQKVVKILKNK